MLVGVLWSVVLAGIVVAPLTGRGWVLLLDWTTGPAVRFSTRVLDGAGLPAGPVFFGGAALLQAVAGAAVGWLVPFATLVVAGVSAARLGGRSTVGRCVAATAYLWNPFVHERLYAGQLAFLAGYALLPNVIAALFPPDRPDALEPVPPPGPASGSLPAVVPSGSVRPGSVRPGVVAGLWLAAASACSVHLLPLGLVVLGGAAGAALMSRSGVSSGADARRSRRLPMARVGVALVTVVVVTVAWLPALAGSAPSPGTSAALASFATRPDPALGLALGTLGQRGFWRVSPGEPGTVLGWWWAPALASLVVAGAAGLVLGWRAGGRRSQVAVATIAAALPAWVASWGTVGPLGSAYRWAVEHVPGFAVMREAGKFLGLLPLATAVGLAALAAALAGLPARPPPSAGEKSRWARRRVTCVTVVAALGGALLVAAPVALTPGLAWGVGGRLEPSRFPAAWAEVRALVAPSGVAADGRMAVLPWNAYLDPGFTGTRVVRNPAPAFFGKVAEVSDDPELPGLSGSPRSVAIAAALETREPSVDLARLGVGWLLVTPPLRVTFRDPGLELVLVSDGVVLYRNLRFTPAG